MSQAISIEKLIRRALNLLYTNQIMYICPPPHPLFGQKGQKIQTKKPAIKDQAPPFDISIYRHKYCTTKYLSLPRNPQVILLNPFTQSISKYYLKLYSHTIHYSKQLPINNSKPPSPNPRRSSIQLSSMRSPINYTFTPVHPKHKRLPKRSSSTTSLGEYDQGEHTYTHTHTHTLIPLQPSSPYKNPLKVMSMV